MKKRICLVILMLLIYSLALVIDSTLRADVYNPEALTLNFGSAGTAAKMAYLPASHTETARLTKEIMVTTPDSLNVITWTFEIVDNDGISRYSMAGLLEDHSYVFLIYRSVKQGYKYRLTPSGAPGSDVTVTVTPVYID